MSLNSSRPSSSKSKRSRDSNSSASNASNVGKKRAPIQKTLGAAWGANSPASSSRSSSFRKAPFSDFGSYMIEKNRKLQCQFEAEASNSSRGGSESEKPIFEGVSIFVNGLTVPSSQDLRKYMLKHGGRFENYFSRHCVTHIICSNLPDRKIKNLRSFSGGLPVVKPTWVLDSISANKLMSCLLGNLLVDTILNSKLNYDLVGSSGLKSLFHEGVPYQLDQLATETRCQPKLSDFFVSKRAFKLEDASTVSPSLLRSVPEDSESRGMFNDEASCEVDELPVCDGKIRAPLNKGFYEAKDQPVAGDEENWRKGNVESGSCDMANSAADYELQTDLHQRSTLAVLDSPGGRFIEESSGLRLPETSHHRHSTSEDPNFVENYFKSSRLHFIGTWRNRYRKRFGILSHGTQHMSFGSTASASSQKTTVVHVDMDCFFVSVVVRNHPELCDKPVAVCHSDSPKGTAEISSANYPARDYGVKAGMFVRNAKALCPHLVIVPYDFEAYEEVADQFYNILHKHSKKVQAVSCDEAFLDVTDSEEQDPATLACMIRKEIFDATGCTASAGIAGNLLMARLATRSAKPDGQCFIPNEKVDDYLLQLPIKALPGIGHVLEEKLNKRHVQTCEQLRAISKDSLQKDFGTKTGEMLWNYCRGVDNRAVGIIKENKSIGAEVNWGVRFIDLSDVHRFLLSLCKEVSLRLQGCEVQGRTFTLKIKKRREDAGEPVKYMGSGECENLSHSTTVPVPTDSMDVLQRITMQLFSFFHIDVRDIRGVGLQVSRLESSDCLKQEYERNTMKSWLASATTNSQNLLEGERGGSSCSKSNGNTSKITRDTRSREASLDTHSALPALNDLDVSVLENLPSNLLSEMNEMYDGKLVDFLSENKGRMKDSVHSTPQDGIEGSKINAGEAGPCFEIQTDSINKNDEVCYRNFEALFFDSARSMRHPSVDVFAPADCGLMPSSLSQVDVSVLQQLPKELREDIVDLLPAHRKTNYLSNTKKDSMEQPVVGATLDQSGVLELDSCDELWNGKPPRWIDKFKGSNCLMLKVLAEIYFRSGSTGKLSSILQCSISNSELQAMAADDDTVNSLCKLVMQYIQLKLDADLEETYLCFRLLRRFSKTSKVFKQLYGIVYPYLQTCIRESYGGSLNLSPPEQ